MKNTSFKKLALMGTVVAVVGLSAFGALACGKQDGEGDAKSKCMMMSSTHAFGADGSAGVYGGAMEKMHMDMGMVTPTGDADVDFVNGMIPHHQGAIDMAKILKEKGKDPMLLKMADDIIKAQESEIAVMKKWLAAHPVPAASTAPAGAPKMDEMKH